MIPASRLERTIPTMTYRQRRLAKAERLRGWADKREQKAAIYRAAADQYIERVPFGQPILVGHHSEGRARRDKARFSANMQRSFDHRAKAYEMRSRADNIEAAADHAIYSDDPDAVERLERKLADLEAERGFIRAYNASCRNGEPNTNLLSSQQRRTLQDRQRLMPLSLGRTASIRPTRSPTYPATSTGRGSDWEPCDGGQHDGPRRSHQTGRGLCAARRFPRVTQEWLHERVRARLPREHRRLREWQTFI